MNGFFKRIGGWLAAAFITVVLGVGLQTQNVIARLDGIGANIGFGDRVSMTGYDIFYLGKPYFIFVGMALAIAFLAAGFVFRLAKFGRPIIFTVAGAVALFVMLILMKEVFFGIHLINGAKDGLGIGLQMLAGAMGGLVFARINRPKEKASAQNAEA